jgi:hypothetical protein
MSNKGKNETLLENEGWDDWDESLWEWDESGMVDDRQMEYNPHNFYHNKQQL